MIRPIYLLGNPELRRVTQDIPKDSADIQNLIDDMLETMHNACGIGLAAPQIGRFEKVFVIDVSNFESENEESDHAIPDQPMVFVNSKLVETSDSGAEFEEGCLSIPDIHEEVMRPMHVRIRYLDRHFCEQEDSYTGMLARVIQHEYDHLEGVLFIDHISTLRRRLLKRRLKDISAGESEAEYPVYVLGKGALARAG